jgi:siroheme synthase-like protein
MSDNHLYPVFLKLHKLNILLVGAGNVGAEKLKALLVNSPQSHITIVADSISEDVGRMAVNHWNVRLAQRKFLKEDLKNIDLVFLATNNYELHQYIVALTKEMKILVNVADTPELCDFYLGSVVQKGNLKIGISTNGKSPTVAKRLREFFDDIIPVNINTSIINLNEIRNHLKGNFKNKVDVLNDYTQTLVSSKYDRTLYKNEA